MHQVPVDVQQRRTLAEVGDDVAVPELVEQRARRRCLRLLFHLPLASTYFFSNAHTSGKPTSS